MRRTQKMHIYERCKSKKKIVDYFLGTPKCYIFVEIIVYIHDFKENIFTNTRNCYKKRAIYLFVQEQK